MFKSHGTPGFQMTFANGITVSVQWSITHYRTGRDLSGNSEISNESVNAEVAMWDNVGDLSVDAMLETGNKVRTEPLNAAKGWVSPENVAIILANAAKAQ